jgi:hypothetical protein
VALSVVMAKPRHFERVFGRRTARKRPKRGLEDKNWPKQEITSEILNTPRLARNAPLANVSAPRGCQSVVLSRIGSYGQKQAPWAHVWAGNGPKTARTAIEFRLARPEQEIMSEILNTPRLARNAPLAHLGAPRGCQSVVLSVHMAQNRHSGRMFGWETLRPENGRNATELARPNFS